MDKKYIVILAAGASTRFPGSKLLYKLHGKPMVLHSIEAALNSRLADRVVIVLGHDFNRIHQVVEGYDLDVVLNDEYWRGMSSSVRLASSKLTNPGAIAFHPADVPLVSPRAFDTVLEKVASGALIAIAGFKGRKGHPIAFHGLLHPELMYVSEDGRGLKQVVERYKRHIQVVDVGEPGVLIDVDLVSDLDRLYSVYAGRRM